MRILGEACTDIVDERLERIGFGGLAFASDPAVTGQVGADGLAVPAQVRAIAEMLIPWRRSAWTSMSSSRVSMGSEGSFVRWRVVRTAIFEG